MTAKPWPKPSDDDCTRPVDWDSMPDTPRPDLTGTGVILPPDPNAKWSQRGSSTTTITSTAGVLPGQNLKSWDNWRAFFHQITPVVVTTLVGVGIVTDSQAALWIPLVFAIIDPLLSLGNAQDKLRRIVYGVAGLLQVGGIATGLVTGMAAGGNGLIAAGVGAGVTILSSFLARFFTPTTTLTPITA